MKASCVAPFSRERITVNTKGKIVSFYLISQIARCICLFYFLWTMATSFNALFSTLTLHSQDGNLLDFSEHDSHL